MPQSRRRTLRQEHRRLSEARGAQAVGAGAGPRPRLVQAPACQPRGAISKRPKSNAGATVQTAKLHAPHERALCQAPAGTIACGRSPRGRSAPSRKVATWRPPGCPRSARRARPPCGRTCGRTGPGSAGTRSRRRAGRAPGRRRRARPRWQHTMGCSLLPGKSRQTRRSTLSMAYHGRCLSV